MDKFHRLYDVLRVGEHGEQALPANAFTAPIDPAEELMTTTSTAGRSERQLSFFGEAVAAVDRGWLGLAHCPEYVRKFCEGRLGAKEMRRIGFPWSAGLVRRTRLECAGTTLAARLALQYGLSAHLGGGTHHAHYEEGSGFTIFNDLVVS